MPRAENIVCVLATLKFEVNIASGSFECIHQPFRREELGEFSLSFDTVRELLTISILVRSRSIRLVQGSVGFSTVLIRRFFTASA